MLTQQKSKTTLAVTYFTHTTYLPIYNIRDHLKQFIKKVYTWPTAIQYLYIATTDTSKVLNDNILG